MTTQMSLLGNYAPGVFFISLSVMVCRMDVTSQLKAMAGMLMVHACHHPVFDDKGQKTV